MFYGSELQSSGAGATMNDPPEISLSSNTNSYMYIHRILQRRTVIGNIRQIIGDNVSADDNASRQFG